MVGNCDGHTIRNGISTMHMNPEDSCKNTNQLISQEKSFHQDNHLNGHKDKNSSYTAPFSLETKDEKGNILSYS